MSHPCFLQYCYHHVPSFVSPKFSPQAVLTVPCPVHAASKDLLMSLVYSLWAFCWAQMTTWYEELQAQSLVNQLLSERNLIWVPPAAPSFLLPSSHLSDLHISEISAQPSLFDTHFISLSCDREKYKPTCSFFLSLRKTTHKEGCAHLASLYTGQREPTEVRTWWRIGGVWCSK